MEGFEPSDRLPGQLLSGEPQDVYKRQAYKNVEQVIDSLLEYGLIHVVATLRPLITFKG